MSFRTKTVKRNDGATVVRLMRSSNYKRQLEVSNDSNVKSMSQKLEIKGVKETHRRRLGVGIKGLQLSKPSNSQKILPEKFPTLGHTRNGYNNKNNSSPKTKSNPSQNHKTVPSLLSLRRLIPHNSPGRVEAPSNVLSLLTNDHNYSCNFKASGTPDHQNQNLFFNSTTNHDKTLQMSSFIASFFPEPTQELKQCFLDCDLKYLQSVHCMNPVVKLTQIKNENGTIKDTEPATSDFPTTNTSLGKIKTKKLAKERCNRKASQKPSTVRWTFIQQKRKMQSRKYHRESSKRPGSGEVFRLYHQRQVKLKRQCPSPKHQSAPLRPLKESKHPKVITNGDSVQLETTPFKPGLKTDDKLVTRPRRGVDKPEISMSAGKRKTRRKIIQHISIKLDSTKTKEDQPSSNRKLRKTKSSQTTSIAETNVSSNRNDNPNAWTRDEIINYLVQDPNIKMFEQNLVDGHLNAAALNSVKSAKTLMDCLNMPFGPAQNMFERWRIAVAAATVKNEIVLDD